jgi:nucleotide-binding universal stress UspA family protein
MMDEKPEEQLPDIILVAIDGSPQSQSAAQVAIQIAQSQHLAVQGLYVVDGTLVLDPYVDYERELGSKEPTVHPTANAVSEFEAQGQEALTWLTERCHSADVSVTTDLWFGGTTDMIRQKSTQDRVSWVGLGRRGNGHADDPQHLGQHFKEVAHHTHCPMLVGGDEYHPIRRVLLAYNGTQRTHDALTLTVLLQRDFRAQVDIVAVMEHDNEDEAQRWLEESRNHIAEPDLGNYRFLIRKGAAAEEIVKAAAEYEADLIVVGGYRHEGLAEWLTGSTLDQILRNTPLPLLVT